MWSAIASIVSMRLCTKKTCPPRSSSREMPFVDQPVVPRLDVGEHRRAIARRRLHQRHVAQAGERQVQRARDRRRREREHVGLQLELLEPLLVLHAEAVLLVDDDQSEIRELDVGTQQPVRADDDVDLLLLELGEDRRLLLRRSGSGSAPRRAPGKSARRSAKVRECCSARIVVGTSTATCRSALHRLERGAHGDLGLAVADVADEQAIHGARALHVALHVVGRRCAGRACPRRGTTTRAAAATACRERAAGRVAILPPRVQVEQLDCVISSIATRVLLALLRPASSAQLVRAVAAGRRRRHVVAPTGSARSDRCGRAGR